MRKDGSDVERMTNDQSDDWFPHPSLDGKSFLYLTYAAGTGGDPRNKHAELRLFSLDDRNSQKTVVPVLRAIHHKWSQLEQERNAVCARG